MIYYGPFNEDRDRVPVQHLLAYGPMSIRRRCTGDSKSISTDRYVEELSTTVPVHATGTRPPMSADTLRRERYYDLYLLWIS